MVCHVVHARVGKRVNMKLKAVLLDIDGTLVDSNDAHAQAWSMPYRKRDTTHRSTGCGGSSERGATRSFPK